MKSNTLSQHALNLFMILKIFLIRKFFFKNNHTKTRSIFTNIYLFNYWGDAQSKSGVGSNLEQTKTIRSELPRVLESLKANSVLDIPCGDFYWMSQTNLNITKYIGADIVSQLIATNREKYSDHLKTFEILNLITDALPKVDVIFCRDALVHFSYADILKSLKNIINSKSDFLITTTFTRLTDNIDIQTGQWRTLNLELAPFFFPAPIFLLNENCTEINGEFSDKCLGVWKISDLPSTCNLIQF